MDKDIIVAAKWLGASLVLSTLILVIGTGVWVKCFVPAIIMGASSNVPVTPNVVRVEMPGRVLLAPLDVNIRPVAGASFGLKVAPLKVEVTESTSAKGAE